MQTQPVIQMCNQEILFLMVGYVNCSITELYNKLMIYYFSDFVCFSSNNNSMLLSTQITINVKYFHILFLFKNFLPEFV